MSTPPPKTKRIPKVFIFNKNEFTSQTALLNYLTSSGLLTIKDRVILCKYCGISLHPVNEATHYFSKHKDKLQFR